MASAEETPSFSSDAEEAKYEIVHLSLVASQPEILRSSSWAICDHSGTGVGRQANGRRQQRPPRRSWMSSRREAGWDSQLLNFWVHLVEINWLLAGVYLVVISYLSQYWVNYHQRVRSWTWDSARAGGDQDKRPQGASFLLLIFHLTWHIALCRLWPIGCSLRMSSWGTSWNSAAGISISR